VRCKIHNNNTCKFYKNKKLVKDQKFGGAGTETPFFMDAKLRQLIF